MFLFLLFLFWCFVPVFFFELKGKLLEGGHRRRQQGVGSVVEMWHNSAKEAANSVCVLLVSECGAHVGPSKQKVNELHTM